MKFNYQEILVAVGILKPVDKSKDATPLLGQFKVPIPPQPGPDGKVRKQSDSGEPPTYYDPIPVPDYELDPARIVLLFFSLYSFLTLTLACRSFYRLFETILGAALGAAAGGGLAWGHFKLARRKAKDKIRMKVKMAPYLLEALMGELPPWVTARRDDNFLNSILSRMWPYYQAAISAQTKANADPMMDYYKPSQLSVLQFKKFELGPVPPAFEGLRLRGEDTPRGREMIMEMSINWVARPDIRIAAEISKIGSRIVPKIQTLTVKGDLKLTFGPLDKALFYPCFQALVISMPQVPKIDFSISYGHSIDMVKKIIDPILMSVLPGIIDYSMEMFVPPNFFTVPMYHLYWDYDKGDYMKDELTAVINQFTFFPEGLLKVEVLQCAELMPPPIVAKKISLAKIGAIGSAIGRNTFGVAKNVVTGVAGAIIGRGGASREQSQHMGGEDAKAAALLRPVVDLYVDNGMRFTAKRAVPSDFEEGSYEYDAKRNTFYMVVSEPENAIFHAEVKDTSSGRPLVVGRTKIGVGKIRRACPVLQSHLDEGQPPHPYEDWHTLGMQQWRQSNFEGAGSIKLKLSYVPMVLLSKLPCDACLLVVRLKAGSKLPATDWNGKTDPFVTMTLRPAGSAGRPPPLQIQSPSQRLLSAVAMPLRIGSGVAGDTVSDSDQGETPSSMAGDDKSTFGSPAAVEKKKFSLFGGKSKTKLIKDKDVRPANDAKAIKIEAKEAKKHDKQVRKGLAPDSRDASEARRAAPRPEVTKVSDVKKATCDPVWNRTYEFHEALVTDVFEVRLYDKDIDGSEMVGEFVVKLSELAKAPDYSLKEAFALKPPPGCPAPKGLDLARITLDMWLLPKY